MIFSLTKISFTASFRAGLAPYISQQYFDDFCSFHFIKIIKILSQVEEFIFPAQKDGVSYTYKSIRPK
jgi:hypothetical protein